MSSSKTFLVTDHLFDPEQSIQGHISHDDYVLQPATAFLRFCVDIKDTVEYCKKHFPKKNSSKQFETEALIKIQHIVNSTLPLMMGHFETYQKYMFAGTFERTWYFDTFDSQQFFRDIAKNNTQSSDSGVTLSINIQHLVAYRNSSLTSGMLIADHIGSWHDPSKVNSFFLSFGFQGTNSNLFSKSDIQNLRVLWQLRHSIVHNAATLTRVDSMKQSDLQPWAGKNIVFSNKAIYEVTKYMHTLVADVNQRLKGQVEKRLANSLTQSQKEDILKFYDVDSPNPNLINQTVV